MKVHEQNKVSELSLAASSHISGSKSVALEDNRHSGLVQRKIPGNGQAVTQLAMIIGETDVTPELINKKGRYKTKLNGVISEEAAKAHQAPNKIRARLTEMVAGNHRFATMREAVVAAIGALTGVTAAQHALGTQMDMVPGNPFAGYPKSQTWRMLMDGKHHGRGKYGFENEKGYMSALMTAYTYMLSTLGDQLTAGSYEVLHDMALNNVYDRKGEAMKKGYRDSRLFGEGFGVDHDTWSIEGYNELQQKYRARNDDESSDVGGVLAENPVNMVGPQIKNKVMRLKPLVRSQCERFAKNVLDVYHREIVVAATEDDRLMAIAKCCQDLDQLHLFVDGNIRTIAFLVLNKLLLQNNLTPVILDEPNVFDCKSVAQLVTAIRIGQAKFRSVRGH